MAIRFHFNPHKAVHTVAYLVEQVGPMDKVKLFKLLYLADRDHFIRCGYPITGDRLVAMEYGPLPSGCLDLLNGLITQQDDLFNYIEVSDNTVSLRKQPERYILDETEIDTLQRVVREHGGKRTWDLVEETHQYPEYAHVYQESTSTTIPYELIAQHHGGPERFRNDRAVISSDAVDHVVSPFHRTEPDL